MTCEKFNPMKTEEDRCKDCGELKIRHERPSIDQIKLEDVFSAYSGKDGRCACGCSGTYYYASKHQKEASKDRGYPIKAEEISNQQVSRIFNIIKSSPDSKVGGGTLPGFLFHASTVIGSRRYTIYFPSKS